MFRYEPPTSIKKEEELADDILSLTMAILDAENALKQECSLSSGRIMGILSEIAERKRTKVKSLETMIRKIDMLRERHKKILETREQPHPETQNM